MRTVRTFETKAKSFRCGVRAVVVGAIVLMFATLARADDGVVEINAACAVHTGCLPGDLPGYPVVIDVGSGPTRFVLTSDLVIPQGAQQSAVLISRAGTTLDLGGFRVITAGCLVFSAPGCDPGGPAAGIQIVSGDQEATIRNGTAKRFICR